MLGDVDFNADADFCELWVNGFGRGSFTNGGYSTNWLEAYVSVPASAGKTLAVGMFVQTSGEPMNYVMLGREVSPNYWRTGFTTLKTYQPSESHTASVVAFFVDVERS